MGAYRKGPEAAGVRANHLGASSLQRWPRRAIRGGGPWVLVDIGGFYNYYLLLRRRLIQASRSVLLGGNDLTQALAAELEMHPGRR